MTPDSSKTFAELEPQLGALDPTAVTEFFMQCDEATRRKLAPDVRKWIKAENAREREWFQERSFHFDPDESQEQRAAEMEQVLADRNRRSDCAQVALLATATSAELMKRSRADIAGLRDSTVKVLIDRRPEWCGEYVDFLLDREDAPIAWGAVRSLVEAGVIGIPQSRGLPDLMVRERVGGRFDWTEPLLERLRGQWDITEAVTWRLFRTPTPSLEGDEWRDAIVSQVTTGDMDRSRVLDETLTALRRDDYRPKQLKWLLGLLSELNPSNVELADRQQAIADLLTTELPAIGAASVKYLSQIGVDNFRDPQHVLHGLTTSALSKTKATAKASLTLAAATLASSMPRADQVLGVAIAAMAHPDKSIRAQAVELAVSAINSDPTLIDAHHSTITATLATLPATESADAAARLPDVAGPRVVGSVDAVPVDLPDFTSLSEAARIRWGVDDALTAVENGTAPAPVRLASLSTDPSVLGELVPRVDDIDALAELIGHALEHPDDWLATERAMDGLSRLGCDLRAIGKRYDALLRQARRAVGRSVVSPSHTLGLLLVRQATGERLSDIDVESVRGLDGLTHGRAQEIALRLKSNVIAPMLSAPSHSNGWITPRVLADRIASRRNDAPVTDCDAVCALMRLHGFDVESALKTLEPLAPTSDIARAAAHAMGAEGTAPIENRALRLAADDARRRNSEPGWCAAEVTRALEDAMQPRKQGSGPRFKRVEGDLFAKGPETPVVPVEAGDIRSLVLSTRTWTPDDQRWAASAAPAHAELAALPALASSLRYGRSPATVVLEPVLNPGQPIGPVFTYLLAFALTSDDARTQVVAQDAYVALIEDGRFDPEREAGPLGRLIADARVKTNRVAEGLKVIAGGGDLHGDDVAMLLDCLVARLDEPPSNAHTILDLSLELHAEYGRAITNDDARATLDAWTSGSSQRAKAARQLLELAAATSAARTRAAQHRVRVRVERALSAAATDEVAGAR